MKNRLMLVLVLLLVGTAANAADFTAVQDGTVYTGVFETFAPIQFTQNFDITTIESVQVACGVGGSHTTQNWYLRRFLLATDHGITDPLTVTSVDFGVEQLEPANDYSLDVVLFELGNGAAFTFANMVEVARVSVLVTGADVGNIVNAAIGATIADPVGTDLIVAIDAPDLTDLIQQFRPGANSIGALRDAYIAAAGCGINDPTGVSAINFPDSQTIFVVNGETGGTTPTIEASWGQVKALYR